MLGIETRDGADRLFDMVGNDRRHVRLRHRASIVRRISAAREDKRPAFAHAAHENNVGQATMFRKPMKTSR
jgi:hypothetical protein